MLNIVPIILLTLCKVIAKDVNIESDMEYKVSEDYIYSTYSNKPERYLNPHSFLIVRDISFLQIDTSLHALNQLVTKLEETCQKIKELEDEGSTNYEFEIIYAKFNLSSAHETCEAKGKKLIELQTSDQLLVLLQKLNGKYLITPAGTKYQRNISNFVFTSNGYPFKFGAIDTAVFGNRVLHKYDPMYKDYYMRYVFNGTKALYEFTPQSAVSGQVICMYKELSPDDSLATSCKQDLITLKNTFLNTESAVKSYTDAITHQADYPDNDLRRRKRGLVAAVVAGSAFGGVAAGVLPTLFNNYMKIGELETASERTEKILGKLSTRSNLLDVNQQNLNSAVKEASKLIKLGFLKDNIQSVKIHANSILIFVGKRIDLLHRLTGAPTSTRSYLLSMSLSEIREVVISSLRDVRPSEINDPNILYSFQAVKGGKLYLILKILLRNKLTIKYFVKALPWPKIANDTLVAKNNKICEWFIIFSQDRYIESTPEFVGECREYPHRCVTQSVPKTIISGRVPLVIAQYFNIDKGVDTHVALESKLFLTDIGGDYLVYTSLLPIEIQVTCLNKKAQVSSIIGRGLLHITDDCEVSSPFFTILSPTQLGSVKYNPLLSVSDMHYRDTHIWDTSKLEYHVTLAPIPKSGENINYKNISEPWLPLGWFFIFLSILILTVIILCCFLTIACTNCNRNRVNESYV